MATTIIVYEASNISLTPTEFAILDVKS